MNHRICAAAALALLAPLAGAQTSPQGSRELPARSIPVPETVSPQMQKLIGAPLTPTWNVIPKTAEEWKAQVNAGYEATMKSLPALREALGVKVEPITLDGVKAYMVTPSSIPPQNRNRLLVHVHRKLRQAGVEAVLQVYEGQSHAHYYRDVSAPETREAFGEIAQFFDRHLAK